MRQILAPWQMYYIIASFIKALRDRWNKELGLCKLHYFLIHVLPSLPPIFWWMCKAFFSYNILKILQELIINILGQFCLPINVSLIKYVLYVVCWYFESTIFKSTCLRQIVKFIGNTRNCIMPGLPYEMHVPFVFHFVQLQLQKVRKHKPDTFHVQVVSESKLSLSH